ncbi:hypothetical protein ACF0H5_019656 [Mactra antiquata]
MCGPCGYFIVDTTVRRVGLICSVIAVVLFFLGVLIGYFSAPSNVDKPIAVTLASDTSSAQKLCDTYGSSGTTFDMYYERYMERHSRKHQCVKSREQCWDFDLPRHYIAYHLNGKKINIDGKLNDQAWNEVPWSETFVDIRSAVYPKPYLETKFKMRWDDNLLYLGAYIEEENLWGTYVTHDSSIFRDNGFEMLVNVDGKMVNYKQIQINVLGTMMDQIIYKSVWDSPNVKENSKIWNVNAVHAIYHEGTVNQPNDKDRFWSVEIALPFTQLAYNSSRVKSIPDENEVWFTNFGRSEQKLINKNGKYQKVPKSVADWWSWQPCDVINLHLQDRWGLVQFKKDIKDTTFRYTHWHLDKALFEVTKAMDQYIAINGKYTTVIEELDIPPYLLYGACVKVPEIKLLTNKVKQSDGSYIKSTRYSIEVTSLLIEAKATNGI